MKIRLTQIDGALPNIALMKLSAWHKEQGDDVHFTRALEPEPGESEYDLVLGSSIFDFSEARRARFRAAWPTSITGGTGTPHKFTVEDAVGEDYERYDYSGYPEFTESIGFAARGCRLKCKFCVVPSKEGKPRSVNTIEGIWRGAGFPKKIHLLDNDFFGNPKWKERIAEIRDGGFRVCLSQGINVRLINDEAAAALATIQYRNTKFNARKLYTAWDNLGDEKVFFRGVDTLEHAGIPPKHLMAYMLVGYDPTETWERIWHRFTLMLERGIQPYPMVFDRSVSAMKVFQRWVLTGLYRAVPYNKYDEARPRSPESEVAWMAYADRIAAALQK